MVKSLSAALAVTVVISVTASAQTVRTPIAPEPLAPAQADMLKLQSAMVAAQVASIKPGDEALPCDALQNELVSTMNNPALQAYAAQTNPAYAKELASQQTKGPMTATAAAALAAALTPNAMTGMAGMPPMVPGQAVTPLQMQQAMVAQQQATMAYMSQVAPLMPALMRSQRVTQLAMVKSCTWAGLGLYPGAVIPEAVAPRRTR